ncbi:MAG: DUF4097 domain-containing protein [Butyrivibrio sp.]|nr:DUF4097 domain-containing protein [Acetatifactor muris]MCM1559047.1 DUF4097 domain-containing protein [Butyrivibrio sp.]
MKKFMKGCAVTALIFLALGIVLAIAAGTVRGRTVIAQVVENVTGGRVSVDFDGLFRWGLRVRDNVADSLPDLDYDIDDATSFDSNHDIWGGDVERFCLGEAVERLEIEAGGCQLLTQVSGDDSFYVEVSDAGKFQAYLENGTLYVRSTPTSGRLNWGSWENCVVRLYVPEGYHYLETDIELGAGDLEFQGLDADKVSLGVGAGQITVEGLKAEVLEMEVGAGRIDMRDIDVKEVKVEIGMGKLLLWGNVESSADVVCAMGNVEMKLTGSQRDFNYRLNGALGNIALGSESYSGLGVSKTVDNGAGKDMEIECNAGNITIGFTD